MFGDTTTKPNGNIIRDQVSLINFYVDMDQTRQINSKKNTFSYSKEIATKYDTLDKSTEALKFGPSGTTQTGLIMQVISDRIQPESLDF